MIPETVIIDTGPLCALVDKSDRDHEAVRSYIAEHEPTIVLPSPILPEFSYLVARRMPAQAEIEVLRSIYMGELMMEPVRTDDLARVIEILDTYRDAKLGFVDAALVAIAERLKIKTVLTLDRRHFGLIKPKHADAFELRP